MPGYFIEFSFDLASNALIGFVGNAMMVTLMGLMKFSRFQCVNWICWKPSLDALGLPANQLASNALIGFVGNVSYNVITYLCKILLASNALIGFVGNEQLIVIREQDLSTRFQCVNWICWKRDPQY